MWKTVVHFWRYELPSVTFTSSDCQPDAVHSYGNGSHSNHNFLQLESACNLRQIQIAVVFFFSWVHDSERWEVLCRPGGVLLSFMALRAVIVWKCKINGHNMLSHFTNSGIMWKLAFYYIPIKCNRDTHAGNWFITWNICQSKNNIRDRKHNTTETRQCTMSFSIIIAICQVKHVQP